MGRRKKQTNTSYEEILSSTYISKEDYAKAQIEYSNFMDEADPTQGNVMESPGKYPDLDDEYSPE